MRLAVHRLVAAATTVLVATGLTACGSDKEHPSVVPLAQIAVSQHPTAAANGIDTISPQAALSRSLDAMRATGSYRVSGTTVAGAAIDISFDVGVGAVGTVTSAEQIRLIATKGAVYVSGDPEDLAEHLGGDVDKTIAGKWLLLREDASTGFSIFADGANFANTVLEAETPAEITKVADVLGQPAVGLVFAETGATLWVAATGQPLPVRFDEKGASAGTGTLTFSDFGSDVSVAAPAADAIVDLNKLAAKEAD